jgi:hypothetical protein
MKKPSKENIIFRVTDCEGPFIRVGIDGADQSIKIWLLKLIAEPSKVLSTFCDELQCILNYFFKTEYHSISWIAERLLQEIVARVSGNQYLITIGFESMVIEYKAGFLKVLSVVKKRGMHEKNKTA